MGRITGLVSLSVRPSTRLSVCPIQIPKSKTKKSVEELTLVRTFPCAEVTSVEMCISKDQKQTYWTSKKTSIKWLISRINVYWQLADHALAGRPARTDPLHTRSSVGLLGAYVTREIDERPYTSGHKVPRHLCMFILLYAAVSV